MFVDTHCHLTMLDLTPYDGDLDLALQQARAVGVHRFMSISVDLDDHIELAKIAARHDDVGYSVGVHPCEDPETMARATTDYLIELAQPEKVWAIGETGLDYFHSTDFIAEQKDCFARHIYASQAVKKPVVVHTRSANKMISTRSPGSSSVFNKALAEAVFKASAGSIMMTRQPSTVCCTKGSRSRIFSILILAFCFLLSSSVVMCT